MNQLSRKSLIGALALAVTLSAPLAFAQSTDASEQAPPTDTGATAQSATPTESTAGAEASTSNDASMAAEPAKKSWADVDGDKDGKLTKAEAASVPALAQVFDQADADADGSLTADEYKAYVAKVQGGSTGEDKQQ